MTKCSSLCSIKQTSASVITCSAATIKGNDLLLLSVTGKEGGREGRQGCGGGGCDKLYTDNGELYSDEMGRGSDGNSVGVGVGSGGQW